MEPDGARPPASPPAPPGASVGHWSLTQAEDLSDLRRAAREAFRHRSSAGDGTAPRGAPDDQLLLLILCELATNALKYGSAPITVSLYSHDAQWLVEVRDANSRDLPVVHPPRNGSLGGNGLQILDRAATSWGWYRDPDDTRCKNVWALVPEADSVSSHPRTGPQASAM